MTIALVRPVTASFAQALSATPPDPPIDVVAARAEHGRYAAALASFLGLEVVEAAPDERFPDGCFVEDTAVVAGGAIVITRPGAPSRRDEVRSIADLVARHGEVVELGEGTLDGGDCMRVGRTLYVGRTARTNDAGIAALTRIMSPRGVNVVPLTVAPGVLHLKCVCSPLDDETVLLAEGSLAPALFAARVLLVPAEESYAANAVAHGKKALVVDGHPRTRELVERAGFATCAIDNRELRKADSALTCLSVLI